MKSKLTQSFIFACVSCLVLLNLAGCTSRGMTVTSLPPGAELSINRRVVGQTPMRVGFTHYGTYRFELRKEGYQTLVKEEPISPGFYGYDPAAFVADNLIPSRLNDEIFIHYVLKPLEDRSDRAALLDRAMLARTGKASDTETEQQADVPSSRERRAAGVSETGPARTSEAPASGASSTAGPSNSPVIGSPPGDASAPKPEGPRLAKEYGLEGSTEKNPPVVNPGENKKKPQPKANRVPKEEELLYEEPKQKEPENK